MIKRAIGCLAMALALFACKENADVERTYQIGKNRYTTTVDGDEREYYVHVPAAYGDGAPIPVVFMLHGTSGDGAVAYDNSGWKEVGEKENLLTIYPSSWHYCIIDKGEVKNTAKWNIYPGSFEYCAGEIPRDDIKFLRQVVAELKSRFKVDASRIYLVGFSNGGSMAFRVAVELSDIVAAVVEASSSVATDVTMTPRRNLPVIFQIGNSDDLYLGNATIPMGEFEYHLNNGAWFKDIVHSHTSTFDFESAYVISGDPDKSLMATYEGLPKGGKRNFHFVLIKDLGHEYPNGENHWMKGAEVHWEWFKQFTLN